MTATPKNKAGELTERIMTAFSKFSPNSIAPLDAREYNKVCSHVYQVLSKDGGLTNNDKED